MNLIFCIKTGRDRAGFMRDAKEAGLDIRPIPGLPHHFTVEWPDVKTFPLREHPAIKAIEDGDEPIKGASQSITIGSGPGLLDTGSWAIARTIRRAAPWNVNRIRTPFETFFRCVRDGTGVDVYILDTGIDTSHPCFGGRATNVYEYYSSGGLGDDVGHGTRVASVAVGDVCGIARGALVWSFKIGNGALDSGGTATNLSLTTSIGEMLLHYSGRSGTGRPAVCSISYSFTSTAVVSACADIIDAGIVLFGPAANELTDLSTVNSFPAEVTDAVCVGGLGMADIPFYLGSSGTNYGVEVDLLAPAQSVETATPAAVSAARGYSLRSGTSYASPLAAGVAACMLQGKSRLTTRTQVQAVKAKLLANATTGRFTAQPEFGIGTLPDRILYLDPDISSEDIEGVT